MKTLYSTAYSFKAWKTSVISSRILGYFPKIRHHKIMEKCSVGNLTGFLLGGDIQRSVQLWREQMTPAYDKSNGDKATGGPTLNTHFSLLSKLGLKYMGGGKRHQVFMYSHHVISDWRGVTACTVGFNIKQNVFIHFVWFSEQGMIISLIWYIV